MSVASAKWNAASLGPIILQQNTITLLDSQNNTRYFGLKHGRTINISKYALCSSLRNTIYAFIFT